MSHLAVIASLLIVCLSLSHISRIIARAVARRRPAPRRAAPAPRADHPAPRGTLSAPPDEPPAVSAPEPVARAFPVVGLPRSRAATAALEGMLRRLAGVSAAYVSPVTTLAYLTYLPGGVTEEQITQAIRRDGYRVGDAAHWFDWRHAPTR